MAFLSCRCDSVGISVGVRELPCVMAVVALVVGVCGNVCSCILLHVGGMFFECVLSESCFFTAIFSSKEALGLG